MKEKNLKLIMELIFIFILPLVFILPNFKIEDTYVYDSNGNFNVSSKSFNYLSLDYNTRNYVDYDIKLNDLFLSRDNWVLNQSLSSLGETGNYFFVTSAINNLNYVFYNGGGLGVNFYFYNSNNVYLGTTPYIYSQNFTIYDLYSISTGLNYDDISYFYIGQSMTTYDLFYNSDYFNTDWRFYYYDYIVKDSVFVDIKNLISNVLLIDPNDIVFNIVIDYTSLWFIMFVIWHLLYTSIDFIVHLFRIRKRE